jgi:hypothetical protein
VIQARDQTLILRLSRKEAPALDIPLQFAPPDGTSLPESRYGPQKVVPRYGNSFPGGMLLAPSFASGFWVIPQIEMDDYLRQRTATSVEATAR